MKPHILVILGSTREGRIGEKVATWLLRRLDARTDAEFELVDLSLRFNPQQRQPAEAIWRVL